jgi:lysophospholipase L1-like esterase
MEATMAKAHPASGPRHGETPGPGPALRLALLGDSSAAGFGAPDHATALAGQLATALATHLGRAVSWRVAARGGATARTVTALLPHLTDPSTGWRPDLVVIAVGVNDTIRLRRPAAFHRDVITLITELRAALTAPAAPAAPAVPVTAPAVPSAVSATPLTPPTAPSAAPASPIPPSAGGPATALVPVLLSGLPPVHRFPVLPAPARLVFGGHARRLDRRLAAVAAELPDTHHLPVGDIPVGEPGLFAPDGFHPAPAAYQIWGRLLATQAAHLLI